MKSRNEIFKEKKARTLQVMSMEQSVNPKAKLDSKEHKIYVDADVAHGNDSPFTKKEKKKRRKEYRKMLRDMSKRDGKYDPF